MKTFLELTAPQQKQAIEFAHKTLIEIFEAQQPGFSQMLNFDPGLMARIADLAEDAAQFGQYTDEGKPFFKEEETVPFYYLGGCL